MPHDPDVGVRLDALTRAIAAGAAERDRDGGFPHAAFAALTAAGHVGAPPIGRGEAAELLRLLAAVGRGDLSTGRIYEGHVNALILIDRYGTPAQRERFFAAARQGQIFGVWNTDIPEAPLTMEGDRLCGGKIFASGVDGLDHVLVTTAGEGGRQMFVVPVRGFAVDRTWWRPLGMRASGSHKVTAEGIPVAPEMVLGGADDYIREPWLTGGAIRFAAVQAGGMHAVFDAALSHLTSGGRAGNSHQAHRLARMGLAVETGYVFLARAARAWDTTISGGGGGGGDDAAAAELVATAQAARSAVERCALDVLELAERGVGAAGFNAPHSLERLLRDLRTYLRQPDPDGALAGLGAAIARGGWAPSFPEAPQHAGRIPERPRLVSLREADGAEETAVAGRRVWGER